MFHEDRFRPSSNIEVITSAIPEAAVLVLLIGGIQVQHLDAVRWHDIYTIFP
jgi:hypothetical protein